MVIRSTPTRTSFRGLISNASDALDKAAPGTLQDKEDLDVDASDLHIQLVPNTDDRVLSVVDNGIGMNRTTEVIRLIGTLARSGTAELRRKLAEAKDSRCLKKLIGQFGIGFYSTFMVADKVTLVTAKGDTTGTGWGVDRRRHLHHRRRR